MAFHHSIAAPGHRSVIETGENDHIRMIRKMIPHMMTLRKMTLRTTRALRLCRGNRCWENERERKACLVDGEGRVVRSIRESLEVR